MYMSKDGYIGVMICNINAFIQTKHFGLMLFYPIYLSGNEAPLSCLHICLISIL